MTKAKKPATAKNVLELKAEDGEDRDRQLARVALGAGARHAFVASNFAAGVFSDGHQTPIMASTAAIAGSMEKARNGDKGLPSDILAAQAVVLDTMFTELARRASLNTGQHIDAADRYMRLALEAQANCRATLEALTKLHQPREQTVKHVHVNEGGQAIVANHIHQHRNKLENDRSEPLGSTGHGDTPGLSYASPEAHLTPNS